MAGWRSDSAGIGSTHRRCLRPRRVGIPCKAISVEYVQRISDRDEVKKAWYRLAFTGTVFVNDKAERIFG